MPTKYLRDYKVKTPKIINPFEEQKQFDTISTFEAQELKIQNSRSDKSWLNKNKEMFPQLQIKERLKLHNSLLFNKNENNEKNLSINEINERKMQIINKYKEIKEKQNRISVLHANNANKIKEAPHKEQNCQKVNLEYSNNKYLSGMIIQKGDEVDRKSVV